MREEFSSPTNAPLFQELTLYFMFSCHVVCRDEAGGHHSSAHLDKICTKIVGVILARNFSIYFLVSSGAQH